MCTGGSFGAQICEFQKSDFVYIIAFCFCFDLKVPVPHLFPLRVENM